LGKGLGRAYYLNRVDNFPKIRDREKRTDVGQDYFVNRAIRNRI